MSIKCLHITTAAAFKCSEDIAQFYVDAVKASAPPPYVFHFDILQQTPAHPYIENNQKLLEYDVISIESSHSSFSNCAALGI